MNFVSLITDNEIEKIYDIQHYYNIKIAKNKQPIRIENEFNYYLIKINHEIVEKSENIYSLIRQRQIDNTYWQICVKTPLSVDVDLDTVKEKTSRYINQFYEHNNKITLLENKSMRHINLKKNYITKVWELNFISNVPVKYYNLDKFIFFSGYVTGQSYENKEQYNPKMPSEKMGEFFNSFQNLNYQQKINNCSEKLSAALNQILTEKKCNKEICKFA